VSKATGADVQRNLAAAQQPGAVVDFEQRKLAAQRAQDKPAREIVSANEMAFTALCNVGGFSPEARQFFHIFLARALGKSPEQAFFFREADAGAEIPGDPFVVEGSFKRRWTRAAKDADTEQRAAGRMLFKRVPGRKGDAVGKDAEGRKVRGKNNKPQGALYYSWFTQAIVDTVKLARTLGGKRQDTFRVAAARVWQTLPECQPLPVKPNTPTVGANDGKVHISPAEAYQRATGVEAPAPAPTTAATKGQEPRTMRRFKDNAARVLRSARKRVPPETGAAATQQVLDAEAAQLYLELGRVVAQETGRGGDVAEVLRQTKARIEAMLEAVESGAALSSYSSTVFNAKGNRTVPAENEAENTAADACAESAADLAKTQAKPELDGALVDSAVHYRAPFQPVPQSFLDDLRARADLVEVIGEYVELKRAGAGKWKACCPFHAEKTPSFQVTPGKGFYCFGCAAKGDVIEFIKQFTGLPFRLAVNMLAAKVGLQMPVVCAPMDADAPGGGRGSRPKPAPVRGLVVEPEPAAEYAEDFTI
jgi:hypothetical protein